MAMVTPATEETLLLGGDSSMHVRSTTGHVLVELVGARDLELPDKNTSMHPFCILRHHGRLIHRTKPAAEAGPNPIWTVETNSLCILEISPRHVSRTVQVSVWAERTALLKGALNVVLTGSRSRKEIVFLGKVILEIATIVSKCCSEERMEFKLMDDHHTELGESTLALRFRAASPDDLAFVSRWNLRHGVLKTQQMSIESDLEEGQETASTGNDSDRPRPLTVTEMDDEESAGATFLFHIATAAYPDALPGKVLVKPYSDPERPSTAYMTPSELKSETMKPSTHWVEAGSGNIAKLYVEILSCHGLPNIEYGEAVGNVTDAFVCAVFEDALVQTPVIKDELNPHWLPWTQRAFCFNVMRPSSVLYLAAFGYKRSLLKHRPIGRIEINTGNLQRDTDFDLTYNLSASSHVTDRPVHGTLRIRLRIEVKDERAALITVLRPPPPMYVNVEKEKTFYVAQYTCLGEYESEEKFDMSVLSAYRDEIQDYLYRIVYSMGDGFRSLIFWRGQVLVGSVWLPLHSLVFFFSGVLLIEKPQLLPTVLCLGVAWFMLVNMYLRVMDPYPWNRCNSFFHCLSILLLGKSSFLFQQIDKDEGWEETQARKDAWKERIEQDKKVLKYQETAEKKSSQLEGSSQDKILSIEILTVLGKIQGHVGGFLRILRSVDSVILWEESALSFWITLLFLCAGIVSLFLPWMFIAVWTCRVLFWGLCGPQMKLVDILWTRAAQDERHFREIVVKAFYYARLRHEETIKMRAFRSNQFGKYITKVPASIWTPHNDRPLPRSTAQLSIENHRSLVNEDWSFSPGQQLYGVMIPRPEQDWLRNREASLREKHRIKSLVSPVVETETQPRWCAKKKRHDNGLSKSLVKFDPFNADTDLHGLFQPTTTSSASFALPKLEVLKSYDEEALLREQSWGEMVDCVFSDSANALNTSYA